MSPFPYASCLLCGLTFLSSSLHAAQSAPTAPSSSPPTPGHSHANSTTLALDEFVTSATPFARNQVDLAQATTVLSGRSLLMKQQATLGETLSAEAGISATYFGPGASRPIIRGLGGDRIRLLENGVGTLDASVASPDHAVSVEPFLVERIEVVRGPASLLYGSNAVGGAVNVITHRIETELPDERVRGGLELRVGSAADEFARGAVLDVAAKSGADHAVVFHFDAFRRGTSDVRIPGFAESTRIRDEEAAEAADHGELAHPETRGRLPNSALDAESGAAGISLVGKKGHFGLSYSGFDTNYGVPGHAHETSAAEGEAAGVRIALRQRRTDVQGEWRGDLGWFTAARFKLGHVRYRHAEREPDGEIGTVFTNRGYDSRFELLHGDSLAWSGALGAHRTRSDFAAAGAEAFLPPSVTESQALFAFEEITRGPLTWQFGGRVEQTDIEAESRGTKRTTEPSGSLGALWKLNSVHTLAVSIAHTGRSPNAQELFADGPHAGTQAYEQGDRNLNPERSLSLELSLRRREGFVTGALTVFTNRFRGFIFEQPTHVLAVERNGAWEFTDNPTNEAGLPVYRTVQRDANFWGAEVETLWHLHEKRDWQLDLRLAADFTRAREGGRNLPRIPPARATVGLLWATVNWSTGAEVQFGSSQNRVAANETPSEGYNLVSAHVSRAFTRGHVRAEVFLRGTNLLDEEIRPHASFVKELAPLAGRGVTAGVRLTF